MDGLDILQPQVTSKSVEAALGMLRQTTESISMAQNELEYCDRKTQDILHEMELREMSYHERAHLAGELTSIRQRRRAAKDIIETLTPLVEWMNANTAAVNQLKQCLGQMRKAEEKRENRVYFMRSGDANREMIVSDK